MESEQVEWKSEWHDDYLKTVCAFASEEGGVFYIGKADNGEIVGVRDAKKLMESIPSTIFNLMYFHPHIEAFAEDGKTYLKLTIAPQHEAIALRGVYYRRSGSTTVRVAGKELKAFILEKDGLPWTSLISKKIKLSDISLDAVSAFIKRGQEVKRISSVANPNDTEGILRRYKLMTDDGITNAAAVLFGKDPTAVSRASVTKIGLFAKKGGRPLMEDIIEGPVIFQPDETLKRLLDKYTQPRFRLKNHLTRIEVYRYPPEGLREAILNSIVHRQYMSVEHTTISVFPDSVEIYNPGSFPKGWTAEGLLAGRVSKPSNPLIAEVFHDMGAIEVWGVGLSLIRDECEKAGIPEPVYETSADGVRIIFKSGPWSDTGEEIEQVIPVIELTESESMVYEAIAEGRYTTADNVAVSVGLSVATVKRATVKLKNTGVIRRAGTNRKGKWEIVQDQQAEAMKDGSLVLLVSDKQPQGQLARVVNLNLPSGDDTKNDTKNDTKKRE